MTAATPAAVSTRKRAALLPGRVASSKRIGNEDLLELAADEKFVIRMRRRPGDFVAEEATLAEIWPAAE